MDLAKHHHHLIDQIEILAVEASTKEGENWAFLYSDLCIFLEYNYKFWVDKYSGFIFSWLSKWLFPNIYFISEVFYLSFKDMWEILSSSSFLGSFGDYKHRESGSILFTD